MGRNAKRAKQARRDKQRREDARRRGPSVTVHEVRTPDDLRAALAKMIATPKSGDWRPDVLGQNSLSMQPGPDGWPLINGHRVTREMCQALQAERPDQAGHFTYEDIVAMAQELGRPTSRSQKKSSRPSAPTGAPASSSITATAACRARAALTAPELPSPTTAGTNVTGSARAPSARAHRSPGPANHDDRQVALRESAVEDKPRSLRD